MSGSGEEDAAALSDFEEDDLDSAAVVLPSPKSDQHEDQSEVKFLAAKKELEEVRKKLSISQESLEQATKQRDEALKQAEIASKSREQARSEIETSAKLLIAGAEKLASLLGENKTFPGGLPRTSKYTGLAAICHGFCKRAEELFEETVKQRDAAVKGRNEAREQMDQRNYQIAIEVSQLEASIAKSKGELERKASELQKVNTEKFREAEEHKAAVEKVRNLEMQQEKLRNILVEQMKRCLATEESIVSFLHKIDGKVVTSVASLSFSDFNDTEKVHQEYVRRVNSISNMLVHAKNRWEEKEEQRTKEKNVLEKDLQRLSQREAEMVAFLRNSLLNNEGEIANVEDDMHTLASLLDGELRRVRLKALDLEKQLEDASVEIEKLNKLSALQAKDLAAKAAYINELEVKHGIVSENVEGLTAEIAAAEEELMRWKKAATEEAAAGVAILEEVEKCNQEIAALNQLVIHLRQSLEEANNKLQSKEEMAAAAIAARNAADRSLRIADERAAELRERLEDMSRQLEELEAQVERNTICGGKILEIFPWVRDKITSYRISLRQATHQSAEMEELTQPLVV